MKALEALVAFTIAFILTLYINPQLVANWFYEFQSHLFELQMEAWDE